VVLFLSPARGVARHPSLQRARNATFCAIYALKCVILPRQARDKHRENSKKEWLRLSQAMPPFAHRDPGVIGLLGTGAERKKDFHFGIISDGMQKTQTVSQRSVLFLSTF
jgi:hypothetical protein